MLDWSISEKNIEKDFDRIAQQLLEGYCLCVGAQKYQLTELEFYYNTTVGDKDNFAHKHPKYFPSGTWRLHGAGLDIVLSKQGQYYGGILIRGLQPLGKDGRLLEAYIDGPWNTATCCIAQKGAVTSSVGFYLEALGHPLKTTFQKSPRVGLSLRKEEDLKYICKPWRYSRVPIRSQRYRHLIFLQAYVEGKDLQKELGLYKRSKMNYIQYFEEGRAMAATDFINGGTGVQHTCRLFGYCYQYDLIR